MKTIMFPGQGSQYKGMGKDLFKIYRAETQLASEILGYDLEELCIKNPERQLNKTQFTQPALFAVNAFQYYEYSKSVKPDFLVGHSLGEYNALLAAGAFDFETGLRLVKKRGALMAEASGGGMAAVIGLDAENLRKKLNDGGFLDIDIANYNSPDQIVVSGQHDGIKQIVKYFGSQGIRIIPLAVSAPFHSRYMQPAAEQFADYLKEFNFSELKHIVIANVTAQPYQFHEIKKMLSTQICSSVQWVNTIKYLMGQGVNEYEEVGRNVLTKFVKAIQEKCKPIIEDKKPVISVDTKTKDFSKDKNGRHQKTLATSLGNKVFVKEYGIKYAYLAGAMYRGIASKELVIRLAKANMLGYLGTGGMSLEEMEKNIRYIQNELDNGQAYGMNLLHNFEDPKFEMDTVKLFLKYGIEKIEASAFMVMTKAIVYYHLKGLRKDLNGQIINDHKILAKVSRPEVAEVFMQPAPERIVQKLLDEGLVSEEQVNLAKSIPISFDICVEADSGGHTDRGVAMVLLPSIQRLRDDMVQKYAYDKNIRVGLAGGIGTPQAAACAFVMGADFILTGSINQCTVEAGTNDTVKDLLQQINVQDTSYAPAGDMFEIGARVQVLKKGVLFAARANKLYTLYKQYNAVEEIPEKIIKSLEKNYFKRTISAVWEETKNYFIEKGDTARIEKAEKTPKDKMALIFRWYFSYSNKLAFEGDLNHKVNFQIHTGPALGAFNQWVKGSALEDWRNRHSDEIGKMIMEGAENLLKKSSIASIKEKKKEILA